MIQLSRRIKPDEVDRIDGLVERESGGMGIQLSGQAYDLAVVGVISGAGAFQPGMRIL